VPVGIATSVLVGCEVITESDAYFQWHTRAAGKLIRELRNRTTRVRFPAR